MVFPHHWGSKRGPDSPASAPQKHGTNLGQPAPGPSVWETGWARVRLPAWAVRRQRSFPGRGQGRARRMAGGRQEAGGSLVGDTGPRDLALDPRGPPERSLPLRSSGRMVRLRSFSSQVPRGTAALGCRPEAPRDTTWPEVAPGGSVRPPLLLASSVSRWLARALCSTGARWDLFVAAGRPGRTHRLQGPLGLSGAPPRLSCSLLLCHGVPTTGCSCRRQGWSCQKGAAGSSVSAPQHLLDR